MTDRSRTPPKLATKLLEGLAPPDPALIGDLREGYAAGRSLWWYWRQVLIVILLAPLRIWRDSTPVALGIVAFAAVLMPVARTVTTPLSRWLLYRVIQPAAWDHPIVSAVPFFWLWMLDALPWTVAAVIGGLVVARFTRSNRDGLTLFAMTLFGWLSIKWMLAASAAMSADRHMPFAALILFIVTQVVVPPLLVLGTGLLRRDSVHEM